MMWRCWIAAIAAVVACALSAMGDGGDVTAATVSAVDGATLESASIQIGDVDGDGVADRLVAHPFALHAVGDVAAATRGVVAVRSGVDGAVLRQFGGSPEEILGVGLAIEDGGRTALVRSVIGAAADDDAGALRPVTAWRRISLPDLTVIAWGDGPRADATWVASEHVETIVGLRPAPGDRTGDGRVDMADIQAALERAPDSLETGSLRDAIDHFGATVPYVTIPGVGEWNWYTRTERGVFPICIGCEFGDGGGRPDGPGDGGGSPRPANGDDPDDHGVGVIQPPVCPGDHDCDGVPDAQDCDAPGFAGDPCDCDLDDDGVPEGDEDDDCDGIANRDDCDSSCFSGDPLCCDDLDGDGLIGQADPDSPCYRPPALTLRADVNHDGAIDVFDEAGEDESPGRIVLINDDDDDGDGVPDLFESTGAPDDELVEVEVIAPMESGEWRITWTEAREDAIRVWRDRERTILIARGEVHEEPPGESIYVEGILPSETIGDTLLTMSYERPGCPTLMDEVRLTVLQLLVDGPGEIPVDEGEAWIATVFHMADDEDVEALIEATDGLPLSVGIADGAGPIAEHSATSDGTGVAWGFPIGQVSGRYFTPTGGFLGAERRGEAFVTIPGAASSCSLSLQGGQPVTDGRRLSVFAPIFDQFGNPIPHETPVTWSVSGAPGEVESLWEGTVANAAIGVVTMPRQYSNDPMLVHLTCDDLHETIAIDLTQPDGLLIVSPPSIDMGEAESAHATVTGLNVEDDVTITWTISNGAIDDTEARFLESTVQGGAARIRIDTSDDALTRIGPCIVTATVGDTLLKSELNITDSRAFNVQSNVAVICGDVTRDGVATVAANEVTPIPNNPPLASPLTQDVPYVARAFMRITAPPGSCVRVALNDPADAEYVDVRGLSSDGQLMIGASGEGVIEVASRGRFAAGDDPRNITLTCTRESNCPIGGLFQGPTERQVTITMTDTGTWGALVSGVSSFFGGDPESIPDIAANIAGGMFIVGDIGALVKNFWRVAGFSEKKPNWFEVTLSAFGLATEFFIGAGEIPDAIFSTIRSIVAAIGDTAFSRALTKAATATFTGGGPGGSLSGFLGHLASGQIDLGRVGSVLGSTKLTNRAIRVSDDLGEAAGRAYLKSLDEIAAGAPSPSGLSAIEKARHVAKVMHEASPAVIDELKLLDEAALRQAMLNLARAFDGGLTPQRMVDVLDNAHLFTETYKRATLLDDIAVVTGKLDPPSDISKIVNHLSNANANFARGRLYELTVTRHYLDAGVESVQFVNQRVRVVIDGAVRRTDIDVVLKQPDGMTVLVQAKRTSAAIKIEDAKLWIQKTRTFAEQEGINPHIIRYVTSDSMPAATQTLLRALDVEDIQVIAIP